MDLAAFLSRLPDDFREEASVDSRLPAQLTAMVASARAAWPGVEVDEAEFLRFVADRVPSKGDWSQALEGLHADSLYITCACALGADEAVSTFEDKLGAQVRIGLASVGLDQSQITEAHQQIREKLMVCGAGEMPKVATYSGRGDLRAWVRAVAVKHAISLVRRANKSEVPTSDLVFAQMTAPDDLELQYLKETYLGEFREAFQEAFASLSSRDRMLVSYKFNDGLSIDEIADIYGAHRASAARWLVKIRGILLQKTRDHLKCKLQVGSEEVDSIMRLIQSRLDVTISGLRMPSDVSEKDD